MGLNHNQSWIKIISPKDIKQKFQMLCWAENITITDKLLELMEKEINTNQQLIEEVENLSKKHRS